MTPNQYRPLQLRQAFKLTLELVLVDDTPLPAILSLLRFVFYIGVFETFNVDVHNIYVSRYTSSLFLGIICRMCDCTEGCRVSVFLRGY